MPPRQSLLVDQLVGAVGVLGVPAMVARRWEHYSGPALWQFFIAHGVYLLLLLIPRFCPAWYKKHRVPFILAARVAMFAPSGARSGALRLSQPPTGRPFVDFFLAFVGERRCTALVAAAAAAGVQPSNQAPA